MYDKLRETVVKGLKDYLNVPVIRGNQNITTLESANNGTWGEYLDDIDRIPINQTWSITVQSDNYSESIALASKAREFLCHTGTCYLNDNDVIVKRVGEITNRDNLISIEYEYKNGFDVVFWIMMEVNNPIERIGEIENLQIKGGPENGK